MDQSNDMVRHKPRVTAKALTKDEIKRQHNRNRHRHTASLFGIHTSRAATGCLARLAGSWIVRRKSDEHGRTAPLNSDAACALLNRYLLNTKIIEISA
jgi:hypothetical protein